MLAEDVQDLPRMLNNLLDMEWRNFFISQAKELGEAIAKRA